MAVDGFGRPPQRPGALRTPFFLRPVLQKENLCTLPGSAAKAPFAVGSGFACPGTLPPLHSSAANAKSISAHSTNSG